MEPKFEIRDPIHGFVMLNEWERELIKHPVFQRLRRIRQLALTDMVYPGAMHTRFEHTLGVMHVASQMFQNIRSRRTDFLTEKLGYNEYGLGRDHQILRLACLCHDLGHSPFSHAGEDLMPQNPLTKKPFKHEDYSAAIVRTLLKDSIEKHRCNENFEIRADEVADFIIGSSNLKRRLLWKSLLAGQIDADRADYLLRDSHHIGVAYGHYDLSRLLNTLTVAIEQGSGSAVIAIEQGGIHAAEALILARYMMFTQVYFHKTRRAYDIHISKALKHLLEAHSREGGNMIADGQFPPPTSEGNLKSYLDWDDWRVLGCLDRNEAGENGQIIKNREHCRVIFQTSESPSEVEQIRTREIFEELTKFNPIFDTASASWYKFEKSDVPVLFKDGEIERLEYLSQYSSLARELKSVNQMRVYVPLKYRSEAEKELFNS